MNRHVRGTSLVLVLGASLLGSSACSGASTSPSSTGTPSVARDVSKQESIEGKAEGKMAGHVDRPTFDEISTLKYSSDEIVVAHIERVVAREVNDPNKETSAPGVPSVIFEGIVEQSIKGALTPGQKFNLLSIDSGRVNVEGVSPLGVGQQAILFLGSRPNGAPGIESVDSYYYLVGLDQGVFDLKDGASVARSELVRSVRGEGSHAYVDDHLKVSVADIKDAPEVAIPAP